jgi:polysaccharide pyruvyl transferase WcaK-like protein
VQFSAEFSDDDTLRRLAAQLDRAATRAGCGAALFCAGLAPWHDDPALLHRLAARMREPVAVVASADAWDLCALIASARAYAGSSLHGRIVAMACGVPRVNVAAEGGARKQAAYAATWDTPAMPGTVEPHELAGALTRSLEADPEPLQRLATDTARRYRLSFEALMRKLLQ